MAYVTAADESLFVVLAVSAGVAALAGLIFAGSMIVQYIRHAKPMDEIEAGPGEDVQ